MFTNPTAEASRSLLIDLPHWFAAHQRDLPMRAADVSDWGTLVFEIMSQQTPISRVQPIWLEWMERWPTPTDLAAASSADIIVAWANLGYPSRALRLKACAAAIVEKHDGEVPLTMKELTLLPGVGTYTASALLASPCAHAAPLRERPGRCQVPAEPSQGALRELSGPGGDKYYDLAQKSCPTVPAAL